MLGWVPINLRQLGNRNIRSTWRNPVNLGRDRCLDERVWLTWWAVLTSKWTWEQSRLTELPPWWGSPLEKRKVSTETGCELLEVKVVKENLLWKRDFNTLASQKRNIRVGRIWNIRVGRIYLIVNSSWTYRTSKYKRTIDKKGRTASSHS